MLLRTMVIEDQRDSKGRKVQSEEERRGRGSEILKFDENSEDDSISMKTYSTSSWTHGSRTFASLMWNVS
jgi:hypothetical protein